MKRLTALLTVAALLPGCLGLGIDGHVYDMDKPIGTVEMIEYEPGKFARVHYQHSIDIMQNSLCKTLLNTEAYGCALWLNGEPLTPAAVALLDGADCLVWTPPSKSVYEHEMRHCREGAWHL